MIQHIPSNNSKIIWYATNQEINITLYDIILPSNNSYNI